MSRRRIVLREYERRSVELSGASARALASAADSRLAVAPAAELGQWDLSAMQHVGTIVLPEVQVLIRPKVSLQNLFLLLDVGLPADAWRRESFAYATDPDLLPALADFFVRTLEQAIGSGLVRAYRSEWERLTSVRGRIDFPSQVRRPGTAWPIACHFEEYTADTDENRYLKAAVRRMLKVAGVRPLTRRALLRQLVRFEEVADVGVDVDLADRVLFTRLNRHYQPAIRLAHVVLRNVSLLDQEGDTGASSFLLDMNDLFQRFVANRLRRHLHGRLEVDEEPTVHLGRRRMVPMRPDLVFVADGVPVYVGDAKYKLIETGSARNADYYQLLAYATALDLDEGVLIYGQAEGQAAERVVEVSHAAKRLLAVAVDLRGAPSAVEKSLTDLADWIEARVRRCSARQPVDC